jgi:hypothetical protein
LGSPSLVLRAVLPPGFLVLLLKLSSEGTAPPFWFPCAIFRSCRAAAVLLAER